MDEENKRNKHQKNGAGFYIALFCTIIVIAGVGYVNSKKDNLNDVPVPINENAKTIPSPSITLPPTLSPTNTPKTITNPPKEAFETKQPVVPASKQKNNVVEDVDVVESGENIDFYNSGVVESVSLLEQPRFKKPVDGKVCQEFSGDTLVYNEEMGDWRTHNGIDLLASADSEVCVAFDGVIEDAYTDILGNTVVINHNNGYRSKYSCIDDIENLRIGMELKKGDFLAHVASKTQGENTTEPHLHFELICNDEFVNPVDYFE